MKKVTYALINIVLFYGSVSQAERPFWTEKTTYREGDKIFFVGVASKQPTLELARDNAMLNARKQAAMLFGDEAMAKFPLSTQMNYDEREGANFASYRLIYADVSDLLRVRPTKIEAKAAPPAMSVALKRQDCVMGDLVNKDNKGYTVKKVSSCSPAQFHGPAYEAVKKLYDKDPNYVGGSYHCYNRVDSELNSNFVECFKINGDVEEAI